MKIALTAGARELWPHLRDFAIIARDRLDYVSSETDTRTSLINPFFERLRWEVRNPRVCRQEYRMDKSGGSRTADYVFFDSNENVVIIVEAKPLSVKIEDQRIFKQLNGYFGHSDTAKFGIITNGRKYMWYTREGGGKFLKEEASLIHDVTDPKLRDAEFLQAFLGTSFNAAKADSIATEIELKTRLLSWFKSVANSPNETFTRWLIKEMKRLHPTMNLPKVLNQNNLPDLTRIVQNAMSEWVEESSMAFTTQSNDEIDNAGSVIEQPHQLVDNNRLEDDINSTVEEETLELENGEVLKSSARARAFRFREEREWIKSKNRVQATFDLISRFAEYYDFGPEEFLKSLISTSEIFSEQKTDSHATQIDIAGIEIWSANIHNKSNLRTVLDEATNLFNPPLVEGQDYELWIPQMNSPKKRE